MYDTALVFSGLPVDLPGAAPPRFPARMEDVVEDVIKRWVGALSGALEGSLVGLSSGARGSEVLFLEICRDLGLETRMVIPDEPEAFIARSVAGAAGGDWPDRFMTLWSAHSKEEREVAGAPTGERLVALSRGLARNIRFLAYAEAPPPLAELVRGAGGTAELIDAGELLRRFREAGF